METYYLFEKREYYPPHADIPRISDRQFVGYTNDKEEARKWDEGGKWLGEGILDPDRLIWSREVVVGARN